MSETPLSAPDTEKAASIVDTILDLDALLSSDVRRARKSVRICTKPWLEAELDTLADELDSLTDERGEPLDAPNDEALGEERTAYVVAAAYREKQREYAAAMSRVEVEQMAEPEWRTWRDANRKALESDDTPPEVFDDLVVRCAIAPKMTREQLKAMRERLGHPQIDAIANAAWLVNTRSGVDVPKSLLSSHVLKRAGRAKS